MKQPTEIHEASYAWGVHAAWLRVLARRDRVISRESVVNAPPGTPSHETAAAIRGHLSDCADDIRAMVDQPSGMIRLLAQGAEEERRAVAEALAEKARLPHLNADHRAALDAAIALVESRGKDQR